ncbi:MAG: glycerophosphodiester phosphodiesterase [Candidatus Lambdaproteobacteria bacterium]|nr:glycerophosphodiester phosphodiesterase [Candidatus Lambdaproteobacteria bacterium]
MAGLLLALGAVALLPVWWRRGGPGGRVRAADWHLPLAPPIVCAHRGGAHLFPENTLHAFQAAAREHGCRFLELDVRASADGVPVVVHDADLARVTGRAALVHHCTLAELQALDAAATFISHDGQRWAGRGVTIPTLEAVLRALPECVFSIDVKQRRPDCVPAVIQVVRDSGSAARVLVGAEDWPTLRRIHGLAPELATFYARRSVVRFVLALHLGLLRWYTPPHNSLQVPERAFGLRLVTPRLVRWARRLGLPVLVWTVNDPADMRRLLALGVDGLITDRPDLAAAVIAERGHAASDAPLP